MLALVIVPMVAVTVLATQRVEAERSAARGASELVAVVELQQAVAAVFPPAQLEWIALAGLAELDASGLPRDVVVRWTGADLEQIYDSNLVDLEAAFDDLGARYGDLALADGTRLGDALDQVRSEIEAQRVLSAQRLATAADVDEVFASLDALLSQLLVGNRPIGSDGVALDRQRARLTALGNVLFSAGALGRAVMTTVMNSNVDPLEPTRLAAAHETHVDVFSAVLNPLERRWFERTRLDPTEGINLPGTVESDSSPANPEWIGRAVDSVWAQLGYIGALKDFSDVFHERTSALARERAEQAQTDADNTRLLLWSVAALTLGLTLLVLWSILSPLRRLTRRTAAINRGELDLPSLPIRGPSDVRSLTATVNDMSATLGLVNDQIRRLASGETESDPEAQALPGVIGVSLRRSVDHLASVTSQLHRSEALSSAIIAQAADAIWTVDDAGIIGTANEASTRLTGLTADRQLGRSIDELLSRTSGEATVLTGSSAPPRVLVARSIIDVDDVRVTAVIAHDISERSRFEERLRYQALHDALTGLPNRFAVLEHLDRIAAEHAGGIAVLYLDLDGFKSVNDVQGHAVGDQVLAEVAQQLVRAVREGDFVGRLGGDEFVVITHRFTHVAAAMTLGHRLVRAVEVPIEHDGRLFALSASVGVAIPPAGADALDMIGQADNAVYQAKRRGRGRVELFDSGMQGELDRRSEVELALRHAVGNDELVLHLQPVHDLRTGRFSGAEALIRWMRPGHGMVPPGDFIPVAEQSSLILDIERWVLTQACERLVEWRRREPGCEHRIAVNISGRHLTEGDLLADVEAVLASTGADPTMLELELTESQLLDDLDRATVLLQELRELGITIAVDDFGTGYSSMTYLRELPIDVVKIDRSFVSRATEHGYDSTVIEAILAIGRILDLGVVAEGVETSDQLEYVKLRGCRSAQGFLLARPMPIEDAEAIIFGTPPTDSDVDGARTDNDRAGHNGTNPSNDADTDDFDTVLLAEIVDAAERSLN